MYGWLWRRAPGPWPAKVAFCAVLLGGVLALLWFMVFPVAERRMPFTEVTVDTPSASTTVETPSASTPAGP